MGTTILEVHLHEGFSFSPTNNAPFVGGDEEEASDSGGVEEWTDDSSGGLSGVSMVVALVALVGVAALARRLLGSDDEIAQLDDFAEEAAEASA